jgi:WD domain, G-beta repeat
MITRGFFLAGLSFLVVGTICFVILAFHSYLSQPSLQTPPLSSPFSPPCVTGCSGGGSQNIIGGALLSQLTIAHEWPNQIDITGSATISIRLALPSTKLSILQKTANYEVATARPELAPELTEKQGQEVPLNKVFAGYEPVTATAHLVTTTFNVQAVQPEEQTVDQPFIEWNWNVSPKTIGTQIISMDIEVRWIPLTKGSGQDMLLPIWGDSVIIEVYQPFLDTRQLSAVSLIGLLGGAGLTVPFIWERIDKRREERQKKNGTKQEDTQEIDKRRQRVEAFIREHIEKKGRARRRRKRPTQSKPVRGPKVNSLMPSRSLHITLPTMRERQPAAQARASRRTLIQRSSWIILGAVMSGGVVAWLWSSRRIHTLVPPGTLLYTFHYVQWGLSLVVWSPNAKRLALVAQNSVIVVDAENGNFLSAYESPDMAVSMMWSPDSTRIASTTDTALVWDVNTGKHISAYGSTGNWVDTVAWSPDGTRIASAMSNATEVDMVQIWDASNGHHLLTYSDHWQIVTTAVWSPDGTRVAVLGGTSTAEGGAMSGATYFLWVQIWNANTGKHILTYDNKGDSVRIVAWSPDGTRIASGSEDGTVRVWQAP